MHIQTGVWSQPSGDVGRLGEALQTEFMGDVVATGIISLVSRETGVPVGLLLHKSRCTADVAEARQLAMYLMHVVLQRPMAVVGGFFGRDRTTVSHACHCVEDKRDEGGAFDAEVTRLETAIMDMTDCLPKWLASSGSIHAA